MTAKNGVVYLVVKNVYVVITGLGEIDVRQITFSEQAIGEIGIGEAGTPKTAVSKIHAMSLAFIKHYFIKEKPQKGRVIENAFAEF